MEEQKQPIQNILWHQSGINLAGEPFLQLILNDKIISQMSPEEAREHAQAMIEAAEAAEQDAFLFDWTLNVIGGDKNAAAQMLVEYRKYRRERTGKRGGPTNPRDFVRP